MTPSKFEVEFLQLIEVTFISYIPIDMILFILVFKHVEEYLKDLIKHTQYLTIISQCSEEYASEIIVNKSVTS